MQLYAPALVALSLTLTFACSDAASAPGTDAGTDAPAADSAVPLLVNITESDPGTPAIAPATACLVMTADSTEDGAAHVQPCTTLELPVYPPVSGTHFSSWADYKTYDAPVPWGFLVHSMEHGGIVLSYNCPEGCADVLAAYAQVIADHGVDPTCSGVNSRFIVVPDPDQDTAIAVSAWRKVYRASCLDPASIASFVAANYGNGPEDLCVRGVDNEGRGWCE